MRSLASLLVLLLAVLSAGCGLLPEQVDETAGWSANKLYAEAKTAMGDGAYDKAVKYFEKLEARYPYGRYAQQAQIETAYAYYKQGDKALAIAACDRFIRLHPNHPNVDYMYYLKGLVDFNEDLGLLGYVSMQDLTERDPKAAQEAFEAFKALVERFPESKYAKDSALRMAYLDRVLTRIPPPELSEDHVFAVAHRAAPRVVGMATRRRRGHRARGHRGVGVRQVAQEPRPWGPGSRGVRGRGMTCRVRVPATTANIGPGFDWAL